MDACIVRWSKTGDCSALLKEAHTKLDDPAKVFELEVLNALTRILIHARGANPSFQMYVTGYIRFWNEDNPQCDKVSWTPWYSSNVYLTTTLRKDMNAIVLKLNQILKNACEALDSEIGGVYFVDEFEEKYEGHRFCEVEEDPDYHTKPTGDRTWFIHYQSPYENPNSVTGLGDGTFFDQVDALLIPPKDGKSTADQIKEVNGDVSQLNPAYAGVNNMTLALYKLALSNATLAMLPVTWLRIMHPKGFGYEAMSNAVIDKVLQYGAQGFALNTTTNPEQGLQCSGTGNKYFLGRDDLNDAIGKFCADAAKQKVQDDNSEMILRKYNGDSRYAVELSMQWPAGQALSIDIEKTCKEQMGKIMDCKYHSSNTYAFAPQLLLPLPSSWKRENVNVAAIHPACDVDSTSNPLNWKHGGTYGDATVQYKINPKIDQGYKPGSCSFHLREDEAWDGQDGPGTSRTYHFHVEKLKMFDNDKNEIGQAGFKSDGSGDGDPISCGDSNPYSWETKLPDNLKITPEAQNDYIQFDIGNRSWKSSDSSGDKQCSVGGFDTRLTPQVSHESSEWMRT